MKLKPPETGIMGLWDAALPGFGLRTYPARNGHARRVYFCMTRVNGRQIRHRLGTVDGVMLADARRAARKVFEDAALGIHPKDRQGEEERAKANTFRAVAEDFLTDHGRHIGAATLAEYRRKLEQDVSPEWAARPFAERMG